MWAPVRFALWLSCRTFAWFFPPGSPILVVCAAFWCARMTPEAPGSSRSHSYVPFSALFPADFVRHRARTRSLLDHVATRVAFPAALVETGRLFSARTHNDGIEVFDDSPSVRVFSHHPVACHLWLPAVQGVSGPAALKLSAFGARVLNEDGYRGKLVVNWLAGNNPSKVRCAASATARAQAGL